MEGTTQEDVLRRVLYPKAHRNGIKKKKKIDLHSWVVRGGRS